MTPPVVLSCGAGVQSTALLLLSTDGHLPPIDHAIFADTGWEPPRVYQHVDRLRAHAETHGITFHVVRWSPGGLRADALDPAHRFASMPLFTQEDPARCPRCQGTGRDEAGLARCRKCRGTGMWDGRGMVRRQCTSEYKLRPIKEKVRELLGAVPYLDANGVRRVPRVNGRARWVESWVGISTDEVERIKPHDVAYMRRDDPLVTRLDLSRDQCSAYLADRWPWPVEKSACIGCPFHDDTEWRAMRDTDPASFADACDFDDLIRGDNRRAAMPNLRGLAYLHRRRIPLREVNFDAPDEPLRLFDEPRACNPFDCRREASA